jgi:hypothetical protein
MFNRGEIKCIYFRWVLLDYTVIDYRKVEHESGDEAPDLGTSFEEVWSYRHCIERTLLG